MKRMAIDQLLPGMVLVKPVLNASGLPVVPVGAALEEPLIERLRQLGLNSVYVEGDEEDASGKTLSELESELEHRFRNVLRDPIQAVILRHIRNNLRAAHGVQEEGGAGGQ